MADFPVAHHIMEISEDSDGVRGVVGVKHWTFRFDNQQVSGVSCPSVSINRILFEDFNIK